MTTPRQRAGQRSARLLRESLSQTEGAIRRRFQLTLTDDPVTREKYKRWVDRWEDQKGTMGADYRGLLKK